MEKYTALAVVYEMALAYAGLHEQAGLTQDFEEDVALSTIKKLLAEVENNPSDFNKE